jgi:hypothetical protein
MNKKFEILNQMTVENTDELNIDDYLSAVKDNRERIRSLVSMLLGVCGMLLSAGLIILFFLIQEKLTQQEPSIYLLMFLAIAALIVSMLTSLIAVQIRPPMAVSTKGKRLDHQLRIYQHEYRWSVVSSVFLFVAILLFVVTLVIFAVRFG